MDWSIVEQITNSVSSLVTSIAIIIGGIWTYLRFIRQVEYFPHIDFEVNLRFVGIQNNEWLVELQASIINKGKVRHEIHDFQFDLRYLKASDELQVGDNEINNQTLIPHLLKEENWLPPSWGFGFADPGTSSHFNYITNVPIDATFVLLHGRFRYKDEKFFHTADKILKVPEKEALINKHQPIMKDQITE